MKKCVLLAEKSECQNLDNSPRKIRPFYLEKILCFHFVFILWWKHDQNIMADGRERGFVVFPCQRRVWIGSSLLEWLHERMGRNHNAKIPIWQLNYSNFLMPFPWRFGNTFYPFRVRQCPPIWMKKESKVLCSRVYSRHSCWKQTPGFTHFFCVYYIFVWRWSDSLIARYRLETPIEKSKMMMMLMGSKVDSRT